MITNIIIIILIIFIFYLINLLLKPLEHMSMKNIRLNEKLNENGYRIDSDKFVILKDDVIYLLIFFLLKINLHFTNFHFRLSILLKLRFY